MKREVCDVLWMVQRVFFKCANIITCTSSKLLVTLWILPILMGAYFTVITRMMDRKDVINKRQENALRISYATRLSDPLIKS